MKTQTLKSIFFFLLSSIFFLQEANAQIVYTDIPDTTIQSQAFTQPKTFSIDFNNDGTIDVQFKSSYNKGTFTCPNSGCGATITASIDSSAYMADSSNAQELIINNTINVNSAWAINQILTLKRVTRGGTFCLPTYTGNWSNASVGFVGIKLKINNQSYYGWIRISVSVATYASITIIDYAYNSIPNQPILAGETTCTTPTVNITQSGSLSFCAGDSVTFTANGTGYKYQWKKNNANIAGATNKAYTTKTAGDYKCKVTNSCGSKTSGIKTVTVPCRTISSHQDESISLNKSDDQLSPMTTPNCNCSISGYGCGALNPGCVMYCHSYCTICTVPLSLSASSSLSFCSGDSVVLTVNRTGTYQWKKNGVNIAGATFQSYTAKTPGTYKCKVTNTFCGAELSPGKKVKVPCRNSNETFAETFEKLSIYPNPATNSVTIKFPSDETGEIQIVNLFGQIVYSENINSEQKTINVSKFSAGMYVVRWSSGKNNETKIFSVVK